MSKASTYLENALIDHLTGVANFPQPPNIYVGLYTSDPQDDNSGTEVSGVGYARVLHNTWAAATGRQTSNVGDITFPQAGGPWGVVTHFGLLDASTAGNLLIHGPLTTSRNVVTDAILRFLSGKIVPQFLAAGATDYLAHSWLDHTLKVSAFPQPTLYTGLYTSATTDAGGGTEVSGGSYARLQFAAWDAAVNGVTSNTNEETFATATANWGTVTHAATLDALTTGNMLMHGPVDQSRTIDTDDVARWQAGTLVQSLD